MSNGSYERTMTSQVGKDIKPSFISFLPRRLNPITLSGEFLPPTQYFWSQQDSSRIAGTIPKLHLHRGSWTLKDDIISYSFLLTRNCLLLSTSKSKSARVKWCIQECGAHILPSATVRRAERLGAFCHHRFCPGYIRQQRPSPRKTLTGRTGEPLPSWSCSLLVWG